MLILDVVNEMLGTMGEAPLNSLNDSHTYLGAAQAKLAKMNSAVQSRGWWFNTEDLTLAPSALDSSIYLPGDYISVTVPRDRTTGASTRNIVTRGRRLYDVTGGTYVFASPVRVYLKRLVPFEELPELAAQHIAAKAVLQFQSEYDGDTAKSRELRDRVEGAEGTRLLLEREQTRNSQANMLESNVRLQRLKSLTRNARLLLR